MTDVINELSAESAQFILHAMLAANYVTPGVIEKSIDLARLIVGSKETSLPNKPKNKSITEENGWRRTRDQCS